MKKFYQVFSGLAVAMLLALGSMQASAGLDFRFSFLSESPFYAGPVSGTIFGLAEPALGESTGSSATSVQVDPVSSLFPSALTFFGIDNQPNQFSVASLGGGIFELDSVAFVGVSSGGDGLCLSDLGICELVNPDQTLFGSYQVTLGVAALQSVVAAGNGFDSQPVPSPAPLALMLTGVLLLAKRRRQRG